MKRLDQILTLPQHVIPQHGLSRLMHRVTQSENWLLKNTLILIFRLLYRINMKEVVETKLRTYSSFNQFFVRKLLPQARPIDTNPKSIISPVDGKISQMGTIKNSQLIQAKGRTYSLEAFLADDITVPLFEQGAFTTLYLSPKDYHRIHMPVTGKLIKMTYVPGKLFAVNPHTVNSVDNLFARNERTIVWFETEFGLMAMVLVGAIFVGSMETTWYGQITPPYTKDIKTWSYENGPTLKKGEEMGRFNMGSTVVLLFGKEQIQWQPDPRANGLIKMGTKLAQSQ